MANIKEYRALGRSTLLILIGFLLIACGGEATTAEKINEFEGGSRPITKNISQKIKHSDRVSVIEIWQDLDGSVPIRGRSLHFRMYDDATVEFDYLSRTETESGRPRYTYTIERISRVSIPSEQFMETRSLLIDLAKDTDIQQEYKGVALTLDVLTTLTIVVNENGTKNRRIIINDAAYDVISTKYEKQFPHRLVKLLKRVGQIRSEHVPR